MFAVATLKKKSSKQCSVKCTFYMSEIVHVCSISKSVLLCIVKLP